MNCKYCLDDNIQFTMITPCLCSGTNSHVHFHCLVRWLWTSKTFHCPVCKLDFKNRDAWYIITQVSQLCEYMTNFFIIIYHFITTNECNFR